MSDHFTEVQNHIDLTGNGVLVLVLDHEALAAGGDIMLGRAVVIHAIGGL